MDQTLCFIHTPHFLFNVRKISTGRLNSCTESVVGFPSGLNDIYTHTHTLRMYIASSIHIFLAYISVPKRIVRFPQRDKIRPGIQNTSWMEWLFGCLGKRKIRSACKFASKMLSKTKFNALYVYRWIGMMCMCYPFKTNFFFLRIHIRTDIENFSFYFFLIPMHYHFKYAL